MEFSYTVSEAEYLRAWKLERKASSRSSLKTAVFWISIMIGLLLLYRFIQPRQQQANLSHAQPVPHASVTQVNYPDTPTPGIMEKAGPFLVLAGLWILIVTGLVPMRLRHIYRKDPRMQGQFTVNLTPESISTENSVGTLSRSGWNVYNYWCEGKGIIVLMFHSGTYSILSLAGLSAVQQDELRRTLKAALKKK
jgi:hypothetical protein